MPLPHAPARPALAPLLGSQPGPPLGSAGEAEPPGPPSCVLCVWDPQLAVHAGCWVPLQPAAVGTCQPLLGSWGWSLNSQCTPINANLDFESAAGRAGSPEHGPRLPALHHCGPPGCSAAPSCFSLPVWGAPGGCARAGGLMAAPTPQCLQTLPLEGGRGDAEREPGLGTGAACLPCGKGGTWSPAVTQLCPSFYRARPVPGRDVRSPGL